MTGHTPPDEFTASCKNSRPRGYIANYRPNGATRALLDQVQSVLDEYRQYWPLTCRQIFYRLVGAHFYDKNEAAYSRLCHHIVNARRGRSIPFNAIRDDGTTTYSLDYFDDRYHFLRHVRELGQEYTRNRLAAQKLHLEVRCEAGRKLPQLHNVAEWFSVQVYSSGGFDSLTAKKRLADRICEMEKPAIILHLGDFDPSGVSIFESVAADVEAFVIADRPHGLVEVQFERVALTREQVEAYGLPTAPAKASDTRSKTWTGGTCELLALPPNVIAGILCAAIERRIDWVKFMVDLEAQKQDRLLITGLLPAPAGGAQ